MPMDFAASIEDEIDGRPLHLYRLSERRFDEGVSREWWKLAGGVISG